MENGYTIAQSAQADKFAELSSDLSQFIDNFESTIGSADTTDDNPDVDQSTETSPTTDESTTTPTEEVDI